MRKVSGGKNAGKKWNFCDMKFLSFSSSETFPAVYDVINKTTKLNRICPLTLVLFIVSRPSFSYEYQKSKYC
jgi:hypothetical protein